VPSQRNYNDNYRTKISSRKTLVPNPKGTAVCGSCGAVYERKRWFENAARSRELKHDPHTEITQCAACVRAKADYPEGILTISGIFVANHHDEILHTIISWAKKERDRDTLCRIMGIKSSPEGILVKTTNERLVRKLGHVLHSSYQGELKFIFSHDVRLTRVRWHRDDPGRAELARAKLARSGGRGKRR
jgi:NMD protein affecting ribosome stability and mRNA decay